MFAQTGISSWCMVGDTVTWTIVSESLGKYMEGRWPLVRILYQDFLFLKSEEGFDLFWDAKALCCCK